MVMAPAQAACENRSCLMGLGCLSLGGGLHVWVYPLVQLNVHLAKRSICLPVFLFYPSILTHVLIRFKAFDQVQDC